MIDFIILALVLVLVSLRLYDLIVLRRFMKRNKS